MYWQLRMVLATVLVLAACTADPQSPRELVLATTTSVQDSGLLDSILPRFSEESRIGVRVIAVGTGAALRMGSEGNADALLTHAPSSEQKLLDSGAVVSRVPFMENHFVIAGPEADPSGVAQATSAIEALRQIHEQKAAFVSRGDDSGTHKREVALFKSAGIDPDERWPGYDSTGSGMGLSLQVAGTRRAYILSDIGTFLAFQKPTKLHALSKPEPALRNEYSFLRVSAERFGERIRAEEARALEAFLTRADVQDEIGAFGQQKFGRALFRPVRDGAKGASD
ncbi:MAG: solute-binding protein [bacterium]|nr:solute-binding protein [bacterium]